MLASNFGPRSVISGGRTGVSRLHRPLDISNFRRNAELFTILTNRKYLLLNYRLKLTAFVEMDYFLKHLQPLKYTNTIYLQFSKKFNEGTSA